jgi:ABC-type oligopeptide transport system ATPase subunit
MKVGLEKADLKRFPRELSGGQRQRVAIARALAAEPDLLIADEPVSSLDATTQSQIMRLLAELKEELGLTTLFISHDLALVAGFCDVVAVIYQGRLVEMAEKKELFRDPLHFYTKMLLDAAACETKDLVQTRFEVSINKFKEVQPGHWVAL